MNKELLADAYYQYILAAIQAGKTQDAEAKYKEMGRFFDGHAKFASLHSLIAPVQINHEKSKVFVLAIGIDQYQSSDYSPLRGCVNDAGLFVELIKSKRKNVYVTFIKDTEATKANIMLAFEELDKKAKPVDTIAVYFSGHAHIKGYWDTYSLATYDSNIVSEKNNPIVIYGDELHDAIQKIDAINKFLIVDTHSDYDFMAKAVELGNYTVLFGCDDGETAHESQFDGKTHGVFTYAFATVIKQYSSEVLITGDLHEQVVKYIKDRNFNQTPKMVGDITPLFFPQKTIQPAEIINITKNNHAPLSERDYYRLSQIIQKSPLTGNLFIPALKKMGYHLIQKGELDKGLDAFESYQKNIGIINDENDGLIPLIRICDRLGQYGKAANYLKSWLEFHPGLNAKNPIQALYDKYSTYADGVHKKYALVVGINQYINCPTLQSARKDAENWYTYLVEDLQIPKENITLLLDKTATRKTILSEFEKFAGLANEYPVLFFFAGYGSAYSKTSESSTRDLGCDTLKDDNNAAPFIPAILSVDARQEGVPDILFSELYSLSANNKSRFLTCVLDIGFDEVANGRGIKAGVLNTRGIISGASGLRTIAGFIQGIGNLTILPGTINSGNFSEAARLSCQENEQAGLFSSNLLAVLRANPHAIYRMSQLEKEVLRKKTQVTGHYIQTPVFIGAPDFVVFGLYNLGEEEIAQIKDAPVGQLKTLLEQQMGANWGEFPDNPVVLAIAEALLGNIEKALAMLSAAVADEVREHHRHVKANYHLGRILVENSSDDDKENWSQALNAMRAATQANPGFTPAYYYLGKAIRQVSIIEGRSEAVKAFQKYQQSNYIIGHQEEVDQYLDSLDDERLRNRYMNEGIIHLDKNELTEAEHCFQEARLLGENSAFYYMAEIYNRQGDFLRALNSYNQAQILGVGMEDLAFKMGDMVWNFLKNSDVIANVLEDLKAYNENPGILKNSGTESLLDHLSKIQAHLSKLKL